MQACRRSIALLFIALTLSCPVALAAPSQPSVEKVLDFFRTQAFLSEATPAINRAFARRGKEEKIPAAREADIKALVKRIYPAKNLYNVFKVAYAKQISPDNLAAVYAWSNTPIGIKYRQALDAGAAGGIAGAEAYRKKSGAPSANRANALETFIKAYELRQQYALMQVGADLAVLRSLNAYRPELERQKLSDVQYQAKARSKAHEETGREATFVLAAFILKDLKNEEIDELSKFAPTPAGVAHVKAYKAALEGTLASASATLEAQVIKANQQATK